MSNDVKRGHVSIHRSLSTHDVCCINHRCVSQVYWRCQEQFVKHNIPCWLCHGFHRNGALSFFHLYMWLTKNISKMNCAHVWNACVLACKCVCCVTCLHRYSFLCGYIIGFAHTLCIMYHPEKYPYGVSECMMVCSPSAHSPWYWRLLLFISYCTFGSLRDRKVAQSKQYSFLVLCPSLIRFVPVW